MFKQRKHKTFNPPTVFSNENNEDKVALTSTETDFVSKWKRETGSSRKAKGTLSLPILILALVILLICMYLLDSKIN